MRFWSLIIKFSSVDINSKERNFEFLLILKVLPRLGYALTRLMVRFLVETCRTALCSCCSHVTGHFSMSEAAAHFKLNKPASCTSQLCFWEAPRKNGNPAPISGIYFSRQKKMLQYGIWNLSTGSSIYSLYATNYDVHMGNGDVMNYNNVAGPEMDTKRY